MLTFDFSLVAPAIITTAPTIDTVLQPQKKKLSFQAFRPRVSLDVPNTGASGRRSMEKKGNQDSNRFRFGSLRNLKGSSENLEGVPNGQSGTAPPPPVNAANSLLAPTSARAQPSRSDSAPAQRAHQSSSQSASPTKNGHGPSGLFKLPRRSRQRQSLFPLPVRIPLPHDFPNTAPTTPRHSPVTKAPGSTDQLPDIFIPPLTALHRPASADVPENGRSTTRLPSESSSAQGSSTVIAASAITFAAPGSTLLRNRSTTSARSTSSSPARALVGLRARSSTMGSISGRSGRSEEVPPTPPLPGSGRNSTSTAGRSSFSNLFGLGHRFRQNSGSDSPRFGSPIHGQPGTPGASSKQNSFTLSRETLLVPTREEGETPGKYLARLEANISRSLIAAVVSKATDDFSAAVLRSHMRSFSFFGDPMDMALRKLLMEVTLPKETQQIDRTVQAFADRYHECNPGIFSSSDQAYFIAFSIIILHTDVFNKNNKRKMQKQEYLKIATCPDVSNEVLACFYDNIVYTPFIHVDDESEQGLATGLKGKKAFKRSTTGLAEQGKKASKEPLDPYTLIMDSKLSLLRPPIKEVMTLDDPYSYLGTADNLDVRTLQRTFFQYGVVQIVSARSRPDAFMSPETIENPQEAQAGVVEIKVTKVGLLWRKGPKKKTARSPWQEWGAILTGTQLYFFKNTSWIKSLISQFEAHQRQNRGSGTPVVFRPPLAEFKPEAFIPTNNAVALLDGNYKRHKHAFVFIRHGGIEETFLAESEAEMNDWLARLNYAAAFVTAGIRIRGLVGGNYEGQRNRATPRMRPTSSGRAEQSAAGDSNVQDGKIDPDLASEILAARRELMQTKVTDAEVKIGNAIKELELQLRFARHLQVLAPIQQKTREQVMHAAGVVSAKLKWVRIEVWRMKCHRDILALDLEEEKKTLAESLARTQSAATQTSVTSTITPKKGGLLRLTSFSGNVVSTHGSPKSPTSPQRPKSASSDDDESEGEDLFKTPPETSVQPSPLFAPSFSDTAAAADTQAGPRTSLNSLAQPSPRPGSAARRSSVSSGKDQTLSPPLAETVSRLTTQNAEEREQDLLRQAGLLTPDPRPDTLDGSDQESSMISGSPDSRSKVRRSLHRSLRDSRELHGHHHHHRSRKGRESGSSAVTDDASGAGDGAEGLSRAHTSFTLHGKKASVITFGSEWQKVPAEERLRARMPSQSVRAKAVADGNESTASGSVLDDGTASLTSQLTATAGGASINAATAAGGGDGLVEDDEDDDDGEIVAARDDAALAALFGQALQLPKHESGRTARSLSLSSSQNDMASAAGESVGSRAASGHVDLLEKGEPGPEQDELAGDGRQQTQRVAA